MLGIQNLLCALTVGVTVTSFYSYSTGVSENVLVTKGDNINVDMLNTWYTSLLAPYQS